MFGPRKTTVANALCIIHRGQSNGDGNAQGARLANTLWNYKGILAGWPATRVAEPQYVSNPSGVYIYNKQAASADDWLLDNGFWDTYFIDPTTGTSRNRVTAGSVDYFGTENIVAQGLRDLTGLEVFILKPAWSGTALNPAAATLLPGTHNYVLRELAVEAYLRRAVRDFAAFRPNTRLHVVYDQWWQGEGDANFGSTAAEYKADYDNYLRYYLPMRASLFINSDLCAESMVALDFNRNAAEAQINLGAQDVCTERGPRWAYLDQHIGKSLQKQELTVAQANPITKGVNDVTPNSLGGLDDAHSNGIAMELIGEGAVNHIVSTGVLNGLY